LTQPSSNNQVYNRYFGAKAWKGTANKIESGTHHRQNSESSTSRKMIPAYAGPSYEMLTPIVTVTYDYDPIMLNRQSIALAEGWELGTWENPIYTDIQTENQSFTEQISYPANLDYVVSPHAGQGKRSHGKSRSLPFLCCGLLISYRRILSTLNLCIIFNQGFHHTGIWFNRQVLQPQGRVLYQGSSQIRTLDCT
jgi:hypothetical protein